MQAEKKKILTVWGQLEALPLANKRRQFMHLIGQAWHSTVKSPLAFVMSLITVSASLVALGSLLLVISNIGDMTLLSGNDLSCRLYFKDTANDVSKAQIENELKVRRGVVNTEFISKQAALIELQKDFDQYADIFNATEKDNPLPDSIKLVAESPDVISEIVKDYGESESIEYVQYDKEFVNQISQIIRFFNYFALLVIVALFLIVAVIIANTVRLTFAARNDEVVIMRLVGADTFFVKIPCIIEGTIYGFLGSLISIVVVYILWYLLRSLMADVPFWKFLFPSLHFIPFYIIALLILMACAVGAAAGMLAVRRLAER